MENIHPIHRKWRKWQRETTTHESFLVIRLFCGFKALKFYCLSFSFFYVVFRKMNLCAIMLSIDVQNLAQTFHKMKTFLQCFSVPSVFLNFLEIIASANQVLLSFFAFLCREKQIIRKFSSSKILLD
jgi:hypothetical protein